MIEDSDSIASGGLIAMGNAALGPVYSPKGVRRFKALLREERPDIVHLHNVFPLVSPAVVRVAKSAGFLSCKRSITIGTPASTDCTSVTAICATTALGTEWHIRLYSVGATGGRGHSLWPWRSARPHIVERGAW